MGLNLERVGQDVDLGLVSWTSKDALIYALGVGAGVADPLKELQFSTENSEGFPQQMLPTQIVTWVSVPILNLGDFPMEVLLHGAESVELFSTLPVEGTVQTNATVLAFHDKGTDAVAEIQYRLTDPESGALVARIVRHIFLRGQGGWGGDRGPSMKWMAPDRKPDRVLTALVPADRALLYRLAGDRHRLHNDPIFAAAAGFDRPILHGLCTYGYAARLLLADVFDNDLDRFGLFSGRMASPVIPGETLTVEAWHDGGETIFQVKAGDRVVLDRGRLSERGD